MNHLLAIRILDTYDPKTLIGGIWFLCVNETGSMVWNLKGETMFMLLNVGFSYSEIINSRRIALSTGGACIFSLVNDEYAIYVYNTHTIGKLESLCIPNTKRILLL